MKMSIIFIATSIYTFSLFAQTTVKTALTTQAIPHSSSSSIIEPLSVGDEVPDIEFAMLNYPTSKARLSDFRGKLVILDFWATWCTSCIVKFPLMDSLQKQFGDKLKVILVNTKSTGDDPKKIETFFRKWKSRLYDFHLPTVVKDTVADALFTHKLLPHYVLIDPAGRVIAITASDEITDENIQKLLTGVNVKLSLKKDFNADRPLYLSDDISIDDLTHYSFFIKGRQYGLPSGNRLRRSGSFIRGRAMTNTSLLDMYRIVANKQVANTRFNNKRLILDVKDSSKLLWNKTEIDGDVWYKENLYSYELIVPISLADSLYQLMLDDLNRYSGYYGRIEKRKIKCLILVRTGNSAKLRTAGSKRETKLHGKESRYLKNAPFSYLVRFLDDDIVTQLPVIDETQNIGNIDIQLPLEFKTIEVQRKALQKFGLDLIEGYSEIEVFVISDKPNVSNMK